MLLQLLISGQLTVKPPETHKFINVKPITTSQPTEPIQAPQTVKYEIVDKLPTPTKTPTTKPVRASQATSGDYQSGQCTALVASRRYVPAGWGNATNWKYHAQQAGWTVSKTPVAGAIAWRSGHVAYVESVGANTVTITEQNYRYIPYEVRTITVPTSSYSAYLY